MKLAYLNSTYLAVRVVTVSKLYIQKNKTKIRTSRNYKNLDNRLFHEQFQIELNELGLSAKNVNLFSICRHGYSE